MSQLIGKTISLISNSDIRYVGTLQNINSEESTVSLSNVWMFGTEGRRGGQNEVPPSPQLFQDVVFRGSDVKDLQVIEGNVSIRECEDECTSLASIGCQSPCHPPEQRILT